MCCIEICDWNFTLRFFLNFLGNSEISLQFVENWECYQEMCKFELGCMCDKTSKFSTPPLKWFSALYEKNSSDDPFLTPYDFH